MPKMEFTRQTRQKIENVGYMETLESDNGTDLYIYGDIVSTDADRWHRRHMPTVYSGFYADYRH